MGYTILTVFVLLHGLAHMVYTALALRLIPVTPGQVDLTGSSWLLAGSLGAQGTRNVGAIVFTAMTLIFVVVAGGLALRQTWAQQGLAVASFLSSVALLAFWDGSFQDLTSKGFIGLVINVGLLIALLAFRYPAF